VAVSYSYERKGEEAVEVMQRNGSVNLDLKTSGGRTYLSVAASIFLDIR